MKITDNYVFFWSGIYSNWYPCTFTWLGKTFNCSEQAMMWAKAKLFNDEHHAQKIMETDDPAVQKKAGRLVKNFDPIYWDKVCQNVVYNICMEKFSQNESLKKQILEDGENRYFVEASPYDKVWGVGMSEDDPDILEPKNWKGTNYLGLVLDRVYKNL